MIRDCIRQRVWRRRSRLQRLEDRQEAILAAVKILTQELRIMAQNQNEAFADVVAAATGIEASLASLKTDMDQLASDFTQLTLNSGGQAIPVADIQALAARLNNINSSIQAIDASDKEAPAAPTGGDTGGDTGDTGGDTGTGDGTGDAGGDAGTDNGTSDQTA